MLVLRLICLLVLVACSAPSPTGTRLLAVDDAGDTLRLFGPARRIISLAPNATETLVALGARGQLAGRTDYDVGPGLNALPSVGGGIDPSLEKIVALKPDLVIGWHSAGASPVRDRLRALGIPYFAVRTTDTADVFRTIGVLGRVAGREHASDSVAAAVRAEIAAVAASVRHLQPRSTFFVVSDDPPMTAGPHTFTVELMQVAGGRTVFPDAVGQPQFVSLEELVQRQPEVVLLPSDDGNPARVRALATRPGWRELHAFRRGRVHILPAAQVNRMGPGIGETARLFRDAIHPEAARR